jgi:hypothetical protein
MIAIEVPEWIAMRQQRAMFVDLTENDLNRAMLHYAYTQCPTAAAGIPGPQKPMPVPSEGPKPPLPAYLVRAARDRALAAKSGRSAPPPDAQANLF